MWSVKCRGHWRSVGGWPRRAKTSCGIPEVVGPSTWNQGTLQVPPDGLCLFYCFLAAQAPSWWQGQRRDYLGFFKAKKVEDKYKAAAQKLRAKAVQALKDDGKQELGQHLNAGRNPGHEELVFCAKSFGCAILVLPEDADSPPYVFGEGPVGFAVNYGLSLDGAGSGAGHYTLLRSWLPRKQATQYHTHTPLPVS